MIYNGSFLTSISWKLGFVRNLDKRKKHCGPSDSPLSRFECKLLRNLILKDMVEKLFRKNNFGFYPNISVKYVIYRTSSHQVCLVVSSHICMERANSWMGRQL